MALLFLLAARGCAVTALHFNHNLRPESPTEAAWLKAELTQRGIPCVVGEWQPQQPMVGNVQQAARSARYQFFSRACQELGVSTIALGHTRDDQAETLLQRLARGSGLTGLCGMRTETNRDALTLWRPLLGVARAELRAWLKAHEMPWLEDPSNENTTFWRPRLRRLWPALAELDLTPATIAAASLNLQQAEDALGYYAEQAWQSCVHVESSGAAPEQWRVALHLFDLPLDIQCRVLSRLCHLCAPAGAGPVRRKRVLALAAALAGADAGGVRTLGSARFERRLEGVQVMALTQASAAAQPPGNIMAENPASTVFFGD